MTNDGIKKIILSGPSALSKHRVLGFAKRVPGIVYAEYVHVLELGESLSEEQMLLCKALLDYGPKTGLPEQTGSLICTILPRAGTISPWSSKASDIFRTCGLSNVVRVERGLRWFVSDVTDTSKIDFGLLYDRMTQECFKEEGFSSLFSKSVPRKMVSIDVLALGLEALSKANIDLGLSLTEEELEYLLQAFVDMGRNPSDVELMMFAQANSEHCRHKIFNADWSIDGQDQRDSLFDMIRNTYEMVNGQNILSAYTDNAAVIRGHTADRLWSDVETREFAYRSESQHILMKVETHNHPTAIAPFAGAATGSGGEIRDEGAVGRGSKPKAGLTGFSTSHLKIPGLRQPWEIEFGKPSHIVSALEIMTEAPIGAASFNNEYGRPAISGYFRTLEISEGESLGASIRGFHKPVMIAGGVGVVSDPHVHSEPFPDGTSLVVLGGPGMLIGLGGGAASSRSSAEESSDLDFASVQRGNAEMERRCQEVIDACCSMGSENPILLIHDVGAGGLSNALPELIDDAGAGGVINLRNIPSADFGMSPMEIWSNESQERYVLGIDKEKMQIFSEICNRERCPHSVVGYSTNNRSLKVEDPYFGVNAVEMPLSILLGKPPKMYREIMREPKVLKSLKLVDLSIGEAIERVLQFPAVASKKFLITIGDRSITGMVAHQPMIGKWQEPVSDVAVTISGFNTYKGEAYAIGEKSPLALISPAASARMAVAESLTNLVSADIEDLSRVVLSANWMAAAGSNQEDQALYDAVFAVGKEFCPALGLVIPVGKDSLSMQTRWHEEGVEKSVVSPLTLIASAFAPVKDVRLTKDPILRNNQGSRILLIHLGGNRLGGSALAQVYSQVGDESPDVENPGLFRQMLDFVVNSKRQDFILSMHDRSDGGLLVSLLEMSFCSRCGLDIVVPHGKDLLSHLFNEEVGFVVQVVEESVSKFIKLCPVECEELASVRADERIIINQGGREIFSSSRGVLQESWALTSYKMQSLRDEENCAREEYSLVSLPKEDDPGLSSYLSYDLNDDICNLYIGRQIRPKVAILREQGVNGQLEMAAAFERAGFDCLDVHMSDLATGRLSLADFQVLAACGGFSYGDVLGGGGGWAKSILFNSRLRDQFSGFFESEKLVLGICNGCQMISQLKDILPGGSSWPRFVRNRSEQFEARTVMVKVLPNNSQWLSGMEGSVLPVAVAHGEGRAEFKRVSDLGELSGAQKVTMQYVDSHHSVTERYPYNPNGSAEGLAGVVSDNGRTLIMMPHPERVFRACQNVEKENQWLEDAPWLRLFRNARISCD